MFPILLVDQGLPPTLTRIDWTNIAGLSSGHGRKSCETIKRHADSRHIELWGIEGNDANISSLPELVRQCQAVIAIHPYSAPPSASWIASFASCFYDERCLHVTNLGHQGLGKFRFPGILDYTLSVGISNIHGVPDNRCSVYRERPSLWIPDAITDVSLGDDLGVYGGTSAAVCVAGSWAANLVSKMAKAGGPELKSIRTKVAMLASVQAGGLNAPAAENAIVQCASGVGGCLHGSFRLSGQNATRIAVAGAAPPGLFGLLHQAPRLNVVINGLRLDGISELTTNYTDLADEIHFQINSPDSSELAIGVVELHD
ncbi:hypothetical protein [Roseateles sp. MS654]|uniref:hypothetical protein n=1 Tax=Roseateles sp. MS654 TaxID=3412685 RepID=UPI003C2CF390